MEYCYFRHGQEEIVSALVWKVFQKFEAPDYSEEGIRTFKAFISNENLKNMVLNKDFRIFCCFNNDKLVGVLALRDNSHISLLFVDEDYHKQGIAKNLLKYGQEEIMNTVKTIKQLTVNAAPYAKDFYNKMGFIVIDDIQKKDGIVFIPMIKTL